MTGAVVGDKCQSGWRSVSFIAVNFEAFDIFNVDIDMRDSVATVSACEHGAVDLLGISPVL